MLPFTRPTIGEDELAAVSEVLTSGWLTSGPRVVEFEAALEAYVGGGVSVRVFNSGTSALEASLLAAGIGPGDEVIVPAMSFVATANVVLRVGASPVFVDVDLQTRAMDARVAEAAISPRTRAVIPVHFAGLAAELDEIYSLARLYRLVVIEDAAQAIGTSYKDRRVGSAGNPVCFSFHPNKNITTIEGGAVGLASLLFCKRLERIRFHGIERSPDGAMDVPEWGGKLNMPDVGAALGLAQLRRLDELNERRRELAERYLRRLPRHPALVMPANGAGHSWHMFCVCLDFSSLGTTRRDVIAAFQQRNVGLGIHYPAIHLFSLYRRLGYGAGDFPVAERIGEQTLTLPLFPTMRERDVEQVCEVFAELLEIHS
jgi:dTDP-4-amino-4,6-dideoxygalactose transaminase